MLALVRSDYGSTRTWRRVRRRPRGRRRGLIMLNAVGWAALIALGSLVSVLGSLVLPLPAALALGLIAGSAPYAVEWLFTWRDLQTTIDGLADADEAQAAVRALQQHGIHADMVRDPDVDINSEHGTARLTILARHRRRALRVLGQRKTR